MMIAYHQYDFLKSMRYNRREKHVYFIRHGEAQHNVDADKIDSNKGISKVSILRCKRINIFIRKIFRFTVYQSQLLIQNRLTDIGIKQAKHMNKKLLRQPPFDLIVVSPLERALQTMEYAFKGIDCPRIALPLIRERIGDPCNHYPSLVEKIRKYTDVDFSLMRGDKDPYINCTERETPEHMKKRCEKFLRWINRRPEENIAVVSHNGFLTLLFSSFIVTNPDRRMKDMTFKNGGIKKVTFGPSY